MKRLQGRIALITGGASGIGKATAHRFVEEGAKVVISDIQDSLGEAVMKDLIVKGGEVTYLHHDVSKEESWKEVISKIDAKYGRLDVLFNNAGIGDRLTLEETPMETYLKTISVTQNSVFLGSLEEVKTCISDQHQFNLRIEWWIRCIPGLSRSERCSDGDDEECCARLGEGWDPREFITPGIYRHTHSRRCEADRVRQGAPSSHSDESTGVARGGRSVRGIPRE